MLVEVKKYEALAGSDVTDCIEQAKELAEDQSCHVEFSFNGVLLHISQFSDVHGLYKYYCEEIKK